MVKEEGADRFRKETSKWPGSATCWSGHSGPLAVGLGAGSASGSGAEREIVPVEGDQFVCEGATYTITSGSIQIVALR
jgi:hypothetical protein